MSFKVPLNQSTFTSEEREAAINVIESDQLTFGSNCLAFEKEFAKYIGSRNALLVNSGSSANLLSMFAMADPQAPLKSNKKPFFKGAEVIVPALTWSTTIWPIIQAGLKPVFVDSDPSTLQMRSDEVRAAISSATVAICPVHILGNAMDMDEICSIAEAHGLWVFEDACESLGVSWKERNVGTFGDAGSYSFYFSHHISTIEGGMVVTDNDDLAELMRSMRAHGWTRHLRSKESVEAKYPDLNPQFLFVSSGFNLRSTEINAAIGLVQLKKLDRFNDKRRSVTRALLAGIRDLIADGCLRTPSYSSNAKVAPFGFPALCQSKETRDALVSCLNFNEIETRPIICGNMVRQPAIKHYDYRVSGSLPGADEIMDCGLYWGTHPLMTESQIAHLTKTVREFFKS
jgi:CDP-6-deoxy-D-xylo-4-hexulose-3-dehydrase